jgi:hypothetical protein
MSEKVQNNSAVTNTDQNKGSSSTKERIDLRYLAPARNNGNQTDKQTPPSYTLDRIHFSSDQREAGAGLDENNAADFKGLSYRKDVPYIEITEFQPDLLFKWTQKMKRFKNLISGTSVVIDAGKNFYQYVKGTNARTTTGGTSTGTKASSMENELFVPKDDKRYREAVLGTPIDMYKEFFNGKYVAYYEVPYTGDFYMSARGQEGWSSSSEIEPIPENIPLLGSYGNQLINIIKDNLPIDLPLVPEWNNDGGSYIDIATEFHLYNDSLNHLIDNFNFLNGIITGPFWLQLGYKQASPNVYTIHIPGITKIYYATMNIEVTQVGNRRKLFNNNIVEQLKINGEMQIDADTMFPDGYLVRIEFHSLIPNNLNTYLDYVLRGDKGDVQVGLARESSLTPKAIKEFASKSKKEISEFAIKSNPISKAASWISGK